MKAQSLFAGSTSYGTPVEAALAIDGRWFIREYGFNGYGRGWSSWKSIGALQHPTQIKNQIECGDAPEYIQLTAEQSAQYVEFGFKTLSKINGNIRVRLPN